MYAHEVLGVSLVCGHWLCNLHAAICAVTCMRETGPGILKLLQLSPTRPFSGCTPAVGAAVIGTGHGAANLATDSLSQLCDNALPCSCHKSDMSTMYTRRMALGHTQAQAMQCHCQDDVKLLCYNSIEPARPVGMQQTSVPQLQGVCRRWHACNITE